METILNFIAVLLLIIPIFDWTASIILHRAANRAEHENIALRERSRIAIILAVITSLNASLGASRLGLIHFANEGALTILTVSLILVSVPNLYWLYLYYSNKLRK